MRFSISQLAEMSRKSTRTVSRRLEPLIPEIQGKAHLYDSIEALPLIYGHIHGDGERLDLSQERAALAREQTRVTRLKRQELEGQLIPADVVTERWQKVFMVVRSRLLQLPTTIAPQVVGLQTLPEIETAARDLVYRALEELAQAPHYD
jgi:phage terminase Nu1 subunit (DNA packaging protein)